jgi:lipid A 3-O-deacylase
MRRIWWFAEGLGGLLLMRIRFGLCCVGLCLAAAPPASAWDRRSLDPPPPSFVSEVRIGGSMHDTWGTERGSANIAGEVVLQRPFRPADLFTSYFVPRPHVGGALNLNGKTSVAYTGLTWTFDVGPRVFIEGSIGGALHSGNTNDSGPPPGRAALGCSPLFREAGSVGVRLAANWTLMATVEHMSNNGLCSQDRGLTNLGARLGYLF